MVGRAYFHWSPLHVPHSIQADTVGNSTQFIKATQLWNTSWAISCFWEWNPGCWRRRPTCKTLHHCSIWLWECYRRFYVLTCHFTIPQEPTKQVMLFIIGYSCCPILAPVISQEETQRFKVRLDQPYFPSIFPGDAHFLQGSSMLNYRWTLVTLQLCAPAIMAFDWAGCNFTKIHLWEYAKGLC